MSPSEKSGNNKVVVAFSTIDSEKEAKRIARALVEAKLVACVNILPKATSIYFWEEKVCEESEVVLMMKTKESCVADLKEAIEELHPYDVPELIVLPISDGLPSYLKWVVKSTTE